MFNGNGASNWAAMWYSVAFGFVNFSFGLPAIKTIDTLGRRKWLTSTLPIMALLMLAASMSFLIKYDNVKIGVVAMWLFCEAEYRFDVTRN